jgi:excisionase family DNA binding protein
MNQKQTDDAMLPETEAAPILGVSVGTLQVWRSTRRYDLPYAKIGRSVRYKRSDLLAFIERRTVRA